MLAAFDFSELSPAAWYTPMPVSVTIWDLIAPARDMFCAFLAKLLPGLAFGLLVYFGSIHWDWLVDIAFRGFAWLKTGWPLLCKFSTETYRVAGLAPLLYLLLLFAAVFAPGATVLKDPPAPEPEPTII